MSSAVGVRTRLAEIFAGRRPDVNVTRRDAAPLAILAGAVLAVGVTVVGIQGPVRALVILSFATTCPGMAIVRLLKLGDSIAELALGLSVSIALAGIVGGLLLYYGMWSPEGGIAILVAITLGSLVAGRLLPEGGLVHAPDRRDLPELLAVARRGWFGGGAEATGERVGRHRAGTQGAAAHQAGAHRNGARRVGESSGANPEPMAPAAGRSSSTEPASRRPAATPGPMHATVETVDPARPPSTVAPRVERARPPRQAVVRSRSRALDDLIEPRDEP